MSERKVRRHVIAIQQILDATGVFTKNIYVPFVPDEVKVKQVGFYGTAALPGMWTINCDSLAGQVNSNFGFVIDPVVSFNGITYEMDRSPNGPHTFRILDLTGLPATTLNNCQLNIHLEFRKFA
jgi:hypothetical protein